MSFLFDFGSTFTKIGQMFINVPVALLFIVSLWKPPATTSKQKFRIYSRVKLGKKFGDIKEWFRHLKSLPQHLKSLPRLLSRHPKSQAPLQSRSERLDQARSLRKVSTISSWQKKRHHCTLSASCQTKTATWFKMWKESPITNPPYQTFQRKTQRLIQ